VREKFLDYIPVEGIGSETLYNSVIKELKDYGLEIGKLKGLIIKRKSKKCKMLTNYHNFFLVI